MYFSRHCLLNPRKQHSPVYHLRVPYSITIADRDKDKILDFARSFQDMKFNIMSTGGTKRFLENHGIECESVKKVHEGRPNIVDAIKYKVPYITTTSAALAAARGIKDRRNGAYKVKSLQDYHLAIKE